MATQSMTPQALSLQGEVIEIFERQDRCVARVRLESPLMVEVSVEGLGDLHLGDRVVVSGWLAVDGLEEMAEASRNRRRR